MVPKASVTIARYGPLTRRAGKASSAPKNAGDSYARWYCHQERHTQLEVQHPGGIRADTEQGGVTERDFAHIAHHDIQTQQQDRIDADDDHQVDVIRIGPQSGQQRRCRNGDYDGNILGCTHAKPS